MPATADGRSRRRGATKSSKASKAATNTSSIGSGTRTAFSFASVLAVALNVAVIVLVPLWPEEWQPMRRRCPPGTAAAQATSSTSTTSTLQRTSTTTTTSTLASTVRPAAAPGLPAAQEVAFDDDALGYAADGPYDQWSSLGALNPSSLRVLPDAQVEAAARASPCWLAFGLSSVHRKKAEYLGATLSHLFIALGDSKDATIVVHLADFDTDWVAAESQWLLAGFADEVEVGRLHVIHAPERLYNVKQVAFQSLTLGAFRQQALNGLFVKQQGLRGGKQSFLSPSGSHILYWCSSRDSEQRRRWVISSADELNRARETDCPAVARAPEGREALDPNVRGWEELKDGRFVEHKPAGIQAFKIDEGEPLKFGDAPERQKWRSKQNLDYAFLMWYSAGLSDYYMQLEDDVHVVPGFLQTVRKYVEVRVLGSPWVLIAFSKLGFIGKFLNSSHIRSLGQFLHVFHDEAPCDWLVWVWIDILSPQPVSPEIVKDVETEYGLREAHKVNPATKMPKTMRNDVAMYYKPGGPALFATAPRSADNSKPMLQGSAVSGKSLQGSENPPGYVRSTMTQFQHYTAAHAYPPGEPSWFWTSDTCWPRETTPGKKTEICDPSSKFLEVSFVAPVQLRELRVQMGSPGHEQDYIRSGSIQTSQRLVGVNPNEGCIDYKELLPVTQREILWHGDAPLTDIRCVKVVLAAAQEQWVAVSEISILQDVPASVPTPAKTGLPVALVTTGTTPLTTTVTSVSMAGAYAVAAVRRVDEEFGVGGEAGWQAAAKQESDVNAELGEYRADVATPLAALLAALVGLLAGCAGWCSVCAGRRHCASGLQTVGEFTCWTLSFMLLLDALLLFALSPPWPPLALKPRQETGQMTTCVPTGDLRPRRLRLPASAIASIPTPATTTVSTSQSSEFTTSVLDRLTWNLALPSRGGRYLSQNPGRPLNQKMLVPQIRRLDLDQLHVKGLWAPASQVLERKWLVLGMVLDVSVRAPESIIQLVRSLVEAGSESVVLLLQIPHEGAPGSRQRGAVINHLKTEMAMHIEAGRLRAISIPREYYLDPPARRENIEHAVMLTAGGLLGQNYMQIEPDCQMQPGFLTPLSGYIERLETKGIDGVDKSTGTWNMVSVTQVGFYRKVIRSSLLPHLADLLVMFPEVSGDVLLWDFIDIVANQSAPKACKIALLASKRRRPDVLLQYHKSEALIEHVGDSSSLSGKVQRIKDEYFKTHALTNNLFDNPPATVRSNLVNSQGLKDVYGISSRAETMTSLRTKLWKSAGVVGPIAGADAFFELVFQQPVDLVIFNLQMGGHLSPPKKGGRPEPDPDFEFVLNQATLQFGHQASPQSDPGLGACLEYSSIVPVSGRELFWRSPSSRPVRAVSCVKVAIAGPQTTPLVVRSISARSAHGLQTIVRGAGSPARSVQLEVTTRSTSTTSTTTTSTGESLENRARREQQRRALALDRWAESHFAWALTVSLSFGSGALAGVLGCFASRLFGAGGAAAASGRRVRPSPP